MFQGENKSFRSEFLRLEELAGSEGWVKGEGKSNEGR